MSTAIIQPEIPVLRRPEQSLIFIVEDEPEIASLIAHALTKVGFATKVFHDGRSVMEALPRQLPALILLDQMLPDVAGLEILRCMGQEEGLRHIKRIVVSARNSESEKVQALDLGADDYITKPFSPRELVARVRAVLRSGQKEITHRVLQAGNLLADLDSRRLMIDGQETECSTTEFDLLTFFMRHSGQTLSRRHLLEQLWSANWQSVDSRVVDVYVHRLRRKIETDAPDTTRLVTRRGGGYCLIVADSSSVSISG
ncbi:MAG TPA: response regulator transcription factor [Acidobacteriaceae bacterium]|nr:response regulator transcription factor [Acidobacteriaceae bacterium]